MPADPCAHCGRPRRSSRAGGGRGLCLRCHADPAVRSRHAGSGPNGRRNNVGTAPGERPAPEPTAAIPGTDEKVRVLCERARLGQSLWNPLDARLGDAARIGGPADDDAEED